MAISLGATLGPVPQTAPWSLLRSTEVYTTSKLTGTLELLVTVMRGEITLLSPSMVRLTWKGT